MRRPTFCFFQRDARPHTVSRPRGCGAAQGFETISAKPTISAIDQSRASACANQQATAMFAPCRIGKCLGWEQPQSLSDASGRLTGEERLRFGRQVNQIHFTTSIGRRKVSSAGCYRHLHGLPRVWFSLMSLTGHGGRAELLGARPGLTRQRRQVLTNTWGLRHRK